VAETVTSMTKISQTSSKEERILLLELEPGMGRAMRLT